MHEEEVVGDKGSIGLSLCNKKVGFELIVWFQSHILAFPGCSGGVISGTELGSHIPEVLLQMGGSKVCREEVLAAPGIAGGRLLEKDSCARSHPRNFQAA